MPPKKKPMTAQELAEIRKAFDPSKPLPKQQMLVLPKNMGGNRVPTKVNTHRLKEPAGKRLTEKNRQQIDIRKMNILAHRAISPGIAYSMALANFVAGRLPSPKKSPIPKSLIKKSPIVLVGGSPIKVFKSGTPKQRIRIGTRIAEGYTKDQLMNIYKSKGIHYTKEMTKKQLIDLVKSRAMTPILKPVTRKTKVTRMEKLLIMTEKFKSLERKKKQDIKNYADRHAITGVSMKNKKDHMIATIYAKLKTNTNKILGNANKSKVTMRIIIDRLIKEHGWHSNRNINKKYVQKIFENSLSPGTRNQYIQMYGGNNKLARLKAALAESRAPKPAPKRAVIRRKA